MTPEDNVARAARLRRINSLMSNAADADVVAARRKEAMQHRDAMLGFQKQARDADMARFFKGEAQEALKQFRGACLVLGHLLCDPPGDSQPRRFEDWPAELIPYAVRAGA